MSWAQQRQAIKLAAEAGVRARTSAAGSETLPLTHHHLRYAMLSRPNGELTRAGQYYYQLIGRPPPSRQYDRNQPLIREGPNDYIMLRGGAKKLLRSLQPNGNYQLTKLGRHFFKDKWVDWVVHVPVIIRGVRRNGRTCPTSARSACPSRTSTSPCPGRARGSRTPKRPGTSRRPCSRSSATPSRTTSSWSCPTSPTTWTRRGSGPSASRPCRSWTTRWWWTPSWTSPSGPCDTSPTSCFAATRSWSPPSNNGRTSSASPGSSRS